MDFLFKKAGLLDNPKSTLPSDVWDLQTLKLLPEIKSHILETLSKYIPKPLVAEIFIIGSITGYKYKDTSDIDVNVKVFHSEEKYQKISDLYNGTLAAGTRHPINFFVDKFYRPSSPDTWADYKFGAYDLLKDMWLKEPPSRAEVRHPKDQFKQELIVAQHLANNFLRETNELRKDLNAYKQLQKYTSNPELPLLLKRKQREIAEGLKDLVDQARTVKNKRKWEYNRAFGVPRHSFNNIVYKLIEHGQYGELFEALKSIKKDEVEEIQKSIL